MVKPRNSRPAIAAVVVTFDRHDLLDECLERLGAALAAVNEPTELIVIDNGQESTKTFVHARSHNGRVVVLGRNQGFATGVMEGVRRTSAEWIAVVNNDVRMEIDSLKRLLDAGRSGDDVGSVGAQMRFASQPGVINSAGIEADRLGVVFDRLIGRPVEESEACVTEIFGVSGGAALFRRDMLDQLGGFDETFFMFLEDGDLAWRARMAGWRSLYVPSAVAYHDHSATSVHGSRLKHFLVGRNRVRLLAKNMDGRHLRRCGALIVGYDLCYVAYATVANRTLAPLSGRLQGLREWRRYRHLGRANRRPIALLPSPGLRGALRRYRAYSSASAGVGARSCRKSL